jgi:hypothetical protein
MVGHVIVSEEKTTYLLFTVGELKCYFSLFSKEKRLLRKKKKNTKGKL